jgi:hypothetical protein
MDVLSEAEWAWLSGLAAGGLFVPLCEQLAAQYPLWNIPQLVAQCVGKGYVNGFMAEGEVANAHHAGI